MFFFHHFRLLFLTTYFLIIDLLLFSVDNGHLNYVRNVHDFLNTLILSNDSFCCPRYIIYFTTQTWIQR